MDTIILISLLIIIVIIIFLYVISIYNKFIRAKELIDNARAQIATQVESRWDALSNLISATKQYSSHEAETLNNVVKQRQQIKTNSNTETIEESEVNYQGSLSKLIAVAENYPNLKASELYKETMSSVNKYESNVRLSRMTFNDTVTKYNRLIKISPSNLVANILGFKEERYLESSESKKEIPDWF